MTDQHPITPPPELKRKLYAMPQMMAIELAFKAGADQELEACCEWMADETPANYIDALRAARRPKHKTRAEIALEQYDRCVSILKEKGYSPALCIRDALVYLKQLEESND